MYIYIYIFTKYINKTMTEPKMKGKKAEHVSAVSTHPKIGPTVYLSKALA